ncbi:MAG: tRNA uridine-5-carboxymethylaminomethyl(34) synthesis enzyme MnmG [bacterium]|nr:tRNA uridine-5-carboxymethylaminomethyl(34) synthesis enzyme MnmG [bacterium]
MIKADVVVVGGGHAGIEASYATARMGFQTLLVTQNQQAIGRMSCNPAIGGLAKGHLVVELDALGGLMPILADQTAIQFRLLNRSKGPAVWGPRCQSDKEAYSTLSQTILKQTPRLTILEDEVLHLITEPPIQPSPIEDKSNIKLKKIIGVQLSKLGEVECKAVVLATGTFLGGIIHCGEWSQPAGRFGEVGSYSLSDDLKHLGFRLIRLKTGTPPRIKKETIDYDACQRQDGDPEPTFFHILTQAPTLPQLPCWITRTNARTHTELEKGFDRSPMFTGRIKGIGPRYCPSIEDKVHRFAERDSHQLFIEPEGVHHPWMYINGFSSSLPEEVQYAAIRTITGLERCEIARFGYAVEYDAIPAEMLLPTFETRMVEGLYFAGQLNGTSGYEEAAAQGFHAGVNAALKLMGKPPFVLRRDEAYIGVLCDDLRLRVPEEPYRMFTSRAEHRLLLRMDTAAERLLHYGKSLGLVSEAVYERYQERERMVRDAVQWLQKKTIRLHGKTMTWKQALQREGINLETLLAIEPLTHPFVKEERLRKSVETHLRYDGYLEKEKRQVKRLLEEEQRPIPQDLDYQLIPAISAEARDQLLRVQPTTVGEASRLPGVTPADVLVLLAALKMHQRKQMDAKKSDVSHETMPKKRVKSEEQEY